MCPACMTTASLSAAGASSAAGVVVLLVSNFRNTDAKLPLPTVRTEGGADGSPAHRIAR